MDKPTKPTDLMPRTFGGLKENYSTSLQQTGVEPNVPVIYHGKNFNYEKNAIGQELDYCEKIVDFINGIPIGKTITVDNNNKLQYADLAQNVPIATTETAGIVKPDGETITVDENGVVTAKSMSRNIGEIVASTIPLTDAGLHLLDGALLQYGSYQAFIDYIADLYDNTTDKYSNVIKVGTLADTDGVLSGFNSTSWAKGKVFNPSTSNWEIDLKFTTGDTISGVEQSILCTTTEYQSIYLVLGTDGILYVASYINGTSTFLFDVGTYNVAANTTYYAKIIYDSTNGYELKISTDGETYTTEGTSSVTTPITSGQTLVLGTDNISGSLGGHPFLGSIDLNESYINIDGSRWWTGRQKVGFADENTWQASVDTYSVCGKFVYDSVNNTVRLPKITGFTEGTIDPTALGDLVEAGLPNITGGIGIRVPYADSAGTTGAFYYHNDTTSCFGYTGSASGTDNPYLDASRSSSIYGNSSTVQPQAIKVLYYIVIATSTKTDIQVDIDEVVTDLNGKADVDLTNLNNQGTIVIAHNAMPSNTYIDLTLGASGTSYTAPADGYVSISKVVGGDWYYLSVDLYDSNNVMIGCIFADCYRTSPATAFVPVYKGQKFIVNYNASGATNWFRFIYAVGSESEAN